jgi:hypothetical protein
MGMIESLHKVFWNFFRRWSAVNQNRQDFISALPKFVKNYNNREHSTTKQNLKTRFFNKKPIPLFQHQSPLLFDVGDRVRIRRERQRFEKSSFLSTVSDQVYELVNHTGQRWQLKNIKSGHVLETT